MGDIRLKFGMEPITYTERTCIIVIHVETTVVGLIVEKTTEVDAVTEKDIISLTESGGHRAVHSEEYIYGLAKGEDRVILLLRLELLIETEEAELPKETQEEE